MQGRSSGDFSIVIPLSFIDSAYTVIRYIGTFVESLPEPHHSKALFNTFVTLKPIR